MNIADTIDLTRSIENDLVEISDELAKRAERIKGLEAELDKIKESTFEKCPYCSGSGRAGERWRLECPHCNGRGIKNG